jgi:ribonuclease HI
MFTVYSDGGSRGNPGKAAYAIVVTEDGEILHEHAEYLGIHTNNYAEYRGLIAGIAKVLDYKATEAEFVMDSQLVIRQMNGEYKVKNPDMKVLYEDAKSLCSMIPKVSFRNVRRSEELIPRADFLLNKELDRHRSLDRRCEI